MSTRKPSEDELVYAVKTARRVADLALPQQAGDFPVEDTEAMALRPEAFRQVLAETLRCMREE